MVEVRVNLVSGNLQVDHLLTDFFTVGKPLNPSGPQYLGMIIPSHPTYRVQRANWIMYIEHTLCCASVSYDDCVVW